MSAPSPAIDSSDSGFAERYRAMSSRDVRFDGQFITGVHSTGIYCRPSCPAMTPKPQNITFYRTAAAAHEAGLRACKRCLPDAVPGSPEWNLRDDLASRAMRLIVDGTVEREGVPGLAQRLGYTSRHLGRVLTAELGAGPLALARAHRAQTARSLLVGTDLPIADVAFASGFSSVRQFNETVRSVYETTPSALRARHARRMPTADATTDYASADATTPDATTVRLRLPVRPPFDGTGVMRFLADHALVGIESGDDSSFRRLIRLPGGIAEIELRLDANDSCTAVAGTATASIAVDCVLKLGSLADLGTAIVRVRRLLDLDADSVSIDEALSRDAVLAPLVAARPGIRLPGTLDPAEALFRTMIGQQISVAAARTVLGRVAADLAETPGLFPTAEQFAERGREVVRGPASRVASIVGVAEALASGELRLDVGMPADELTARLVAMPGIGPWTAGYLAMRVLGNPDTLLTTDLVMLQSATKLGLPGTARGLAEHGARWAPWRSYAGLHLWAAR
ncbi:DNA-3-methyladenine glycosylase 2 family protein [Lacisediminihabitans changchengi]|uniref:DNA-3-methyladenine glycosylase II n=1 Tax=Lacisediminihabitans changchengi TaxID=2787634 RepID=A0A934SL49_9MICO|nr:Ada metal-binding domain-containing protein [Lacisediminihabitans changchengi]MBK4347563.1 DNA-3-methyladenine glycosylase 2 family protein [Lacisediminihabitans changchengi]